MKNQLKQIPSEAQIRKHFRKIVYGKNVFCPLCRSREVFKSENRYRCKKCRKPFSLLSGTWLSNMKLSYQTFWKLLWCWTQKIPVLQAQSFCLVSEVTVRHWYREFRIHLPQFESILEGKIQMDEAYFRGMSLLMAKEIGSKKIAFQVLNKNSVNRTEAMDFIFSCIKPGSKLQTDGASIYKGVERWWPVKHSRDIHSRFEFGLTSEIEGMFGNLKTFIRRMYHHVTKEYLVEYIGEFCCRFSSPEIFKDPLSYLEKTL